MEKKNSYTEIYDRIFFGLWDRTTGIATSRRQTYVGAKLYGKFLLSEISRYHDVKRKGEHAIERHGLVAPMGVMKAWAFNVLEDCYLGRVAPPFELCKAIYLLMGCTHLAPQRGKPETKAAYFELIRRNPRIGIREAARRLGVNPTTIMRWQDNNSANDPDDGEHSEEYERLRNLTNVDDFYPMRWRVLRANELAQHEQDVP